MPIDVLTAMRGNEHGLGNALTTYPESKDLDQRTAHAACLALEREGKIRRYDENDGTTHPSGAPFVIWKLVATAASSAVTAPADEGEQAP